MSEPRQPLNVMRCRVCSALLKEEGIDFDRGVAICSYCHAVMRFTNEPINTPTRRSRETADVPARFEIEETGRTLKIIWRWHNAQVYRDFKFLSSAAVVALIIFLLFALANISVDRGLIFLLMLVGVTSLYIRIAMYRNTTTITIDDVNLAIVHGPLPWIKSLQPQRFWLPDYKQFFTVWRVHDKRIKSHDTYALCGVTNDNQRQDIITELETPNEALFIEQYLEDRFQIRDEPLEGELPR